MEIKELEARMYYLAGQLDEAKKIYRDALGEIERANKEQAKREAETKAAINGSPIPVGESVPF
jgi:hypothetical protein